MRRSNPKLASMRTLSICSIIVAFTVPCSIAQAQKTYLKNGLMQGQGASVPDGWRLHFFSNLEAIGESGMIAGPEEGTNAVELIWRDGAARFALQAEMSAQPAQGNYILSGQVKTTGPGKAAFLVECFDDKGRLLRYAETAPASSDTWRELTLLFTVPRLTAKTNVYCLNTGCGSAAFAAVGIKEALGGGEDVFPLSVVAIPAEGNAPLFGGRSKFHSFIDSPCPMGFHFWGEKDRVKNGALLLEMSEELRLTAAVNASPLSEPAVDFSCEEIERDGVKARRYTIPILEVTKILLARPRWEQGRIYVVIEPKDPSTAVSKSFVLSWRLLNDGKLSPRREMEMVFLPALPDTPNPKRFGYMSWKANDLVFESPELMARMAKHYEAAAMHAWAIAGALTTTCPQDPLRRKANEFFRARGWKMYKTEPCHLSMDWSAFVKEMPDAKYAISAKGEQKYHKFICPTWFNHDAAFREQLQTYYRQKYLTSGVVAGDSVVLDYEPWDLHNWCFCDECREHFSKAFRLPSIPSAKEIAEKYREQWSDFKFRQSDDHVRLAGDVARAAVPGVRIGIYDYVVHQNPKAVEYFRHTVALDARRIDPLVDFHMLSFYRYNGKNGCDLLDFNVKQLTKPVWMISNISRNDIIDGDWTGADQQLSPAQVGMKLLGAAASGAVGFATFPGWDLDANFFVAIDQAMADVAVAEDFYFDGRRVDQQFDISGRGLNEVVLRAHQLKGQTLVTLINFDSAATAQLVVKFTKPAVAVYKVTSPTGFACPPKLPPQGLKVQLEPLSRQLLILSPASGG